MDTAKHPFKLTYRLCVCLLALLCTCGDIELNPGPPRQAKTQQPEARRLSQSYRQPTNDEQRLLQSTTQREAAEGVITRQRTISSYATPPQVTPPIASIRSDTHDRQETESLYDFLTATRLDITSQNEHVLSEINKVNSKIDNVFETIHELKADNQALKNENIQLREELYELNSKFDRLDSSMRRKSLKFFGIPGNLNETATETERKTREFVRTCLNYDQSDHVYFDEVRRLKSSDPNKPTVLATFNRQRECTDIMNLAKEKLRNNPNHYVQNDYSERVRKHRKLLGERMIAERRQGNYSTIRFD